MIEPKTQKDSTDDIVCIYQHLYIANAATVNEAKALKEHKITHVINLIAHKTWNYPEDFKYLNLSLKDNPSWDILAVMPKIVKFIEEATEEDIDSRIVIHCQMGISRSAATLAGYLITKGKS